MPIHSLLCVFLRLIYMISGQLSVTLRYAKFSVLWDFLNSGHYVIDYYSYTPIIMCFSEWFIWFQAIFGSNLGHLTLTFVLLMNLRYAKIPVTTFAIGDTNAYYSASKFYYSISWRLFITVAIQIWNEWVETWHSMLILQICLRTCDFIILFCFLWENCHFSILRCNKYGWTIILFCLWDACTLPYQKYLTIYP